ncbi:MAG: cation-translocating P-type ATPase [Candidatus Ozemobacteraceae bacterium]
MKEQPHAHVWQIRGLDCPTCARELERDIQACEGIVEAQLDFMAGILRVLCRLEADCEAVITELGRPHGVTFTAISVDGVDLFETPSTTSSNGDAAGKSQESEPLKPASLPSPRSWFPPEAGTMAVSGLFILVAWAGGLPMLFFAAMIVAGTPVARKALLEMRSFEPGMNLLMIIASVGAAFIGERQEGATVLFLFTVARWMERLSSDRARTAIEALRRRLPAIAHVTDGEHREIDVPTDRVAVGTGIRLRPGERIPLDGIVVSGVSHVDESVMTGEAKPVRRSHGDRVLAGTMNGQGSLVVETTHSARETLFSKVMVSVDEAQRRKSRFQGSIERFAAVYTPAVLVVALLVGVIPPMLFGQSWVGWIYAALVMLVIACPCALVLAAPVTLVSAMAAAAREGILVKGGDFLETAARVRTCAFDKTGTLTQGEPRLIEIIPGAGQERQTILAIAVALEGASEHPLARAFRACAAEENLGLPVVDDFNAVQGCGIEGKIGGSTYRLGRVDWIFDRFPGEPSAGGASRYVERLNTCACGACEPAMGTLVTLADEQRVLGAFRIGDATRPEARNAIDELYRLGISHTVLLSGDQGEIVGKLAKNLGIGKWYGALNPTEKLEKLEVLKKECGPVLMLGDGVNDTPALAAADLGIAMGGRGIDVAIDTADVVFMHDDLEKLPLFIRLARRSQGLIYQNILLAVGLKFVIFVLALTGHAGLWAAVMADTGASVLVVMNGLRALKIS